MGLSLAGRNERLDDMAADYDTMSLHTADPGPAGVLNEVVGGAPAYARQPLTWAPAVNGEIGFSNTPVFNVPKDATVRFAGFWRGGQFLAAHQLTTEQPFINQGTLTFDSFIFSQPA